MLLLSDCIPNHYAGMKILQATVSWSELKFDLLLLTAPCLVMIASLVYDVANRKHDLFVRRRRDGPLRRVLGLSQPRQALAQGREQIARASGPERRRTKLSLTVARSPFRSSPL